MSDPAGKITGNWVAAPAMAPCLAARFDARQCDPCQVRSSCTRGTSARTINFLPQHLHDLQARHRAAQDTPEWKRLYGARPGVEGTINECVNGHRMRRCRYHGLGKAHVQHVLTAIAINIERLAGQESGNSTYRPRRPTPSSSTSTPTSCPGHCGGAKASDHLQDSRQSLPMTLDPG